MMKRKLLLFAILTSAISLASPVPAPSKDQNSLPIFEAVKSTQKAIAWSNCLSFIETHATSYSSATLNRLNSEVFQGVSTWTVSNNYRRLFLTGMLAGKGVGWPNDGMEIEFPDSDSAYMASMLIVNATNAKN